MELAGLDVDALKQRLKIRALEARFVWSAKFHYEKRQFMMGAFDMLSGVTVTSDILYYDPAGGGPGEGAFNPNFA